MIVVTGAAGFIGSCLIARLNEDNFNHIIAVDDFSHHEKDKNLEGKKILARVERDQFFEWADGRVDEIEFIFHVGARTDTAEFDYEVLKKLNVDYSQKIWKLCCNGQIPLVYASSAATYGGGEHGYSDDESFINQLKPMNPYGRSKQEFDEWALAQSEKPFFWAGLKFFNVYGPNEYHKGRMASVVFHAFNQIFSTKKVKLFRSYRPDFPDGEQLRDFVYVKDVTEVCMFLMHHRRDSGIYNLGSGQARTFKDLAGAVFHALNVPLNIEFIDIPEDIRDKYQYYTQADMQKLIGIGYGKKFHTLEEGVDDYVRRYLAEKSFR